MHITTDRMILRPFEERDLDVLAALNADPCVMRYYPAPYSRQETEAMITRYQSRWQKDGYSFAAATLRSSGRLIGLCGLSLFTAPVHFAPMPEIGWRFLPELWRQGYATEAARAWLRFGYEICNLSEIVSFTACVNQPSQAVMRKIGMVRFSAFDFDMPSIPVGHALRPHVVYRLTRQDFFKAESV